MSTAWNAVRKRQIPQPHPGDGNAVEELVAQIQSGSQRVRPLRYSSRQSPIIAFVMACAHFY
jgi:hypothetical protein